jgi:hypothetical protein
MATVHPSAILRAPDDDTRHDEMARFIDDLRKNCAGAERGSLEATISGMKKPNSQTSVSRPKNDLTEDASHLRRNLSSNPIAIFALELL